MAKISVKKLSVAQLVALRDQIQAELSRKIGLERGALQEQINTLAEIEGGSGKAEIGTGRAVARRRGAKKPEPKARASRGKKVAPKYKGPGGEVWTGRGNAPRWLAALEADGKKRESFLIKK